MNTYQNIDITSLFDVSKQIADLIRQNYLKEGMMQQGKLANFTWTVAFENSIYQLQLMLPPEWYWVEFGRRPSQKMPPVDKIEEWVKTHLGTTRLVPRGVNGKNVTRNTKQIAFAIAKKIKREGFYSPGHQGKHVIEKSLQEADPLITQLCNLITNKMNSTVRSDIVTVFEGLDNFETK